jgi:hypothetical protein
MSTANLVDQQTANRRATVFMTVAVGFFASIPIVGLLVIIVLYVGQFGSALTTSARRSVTLPFILIAGLIHFCLPIQMLSWTGSWWAWGISSFAIWVLVSYLWPKVQAI